MRIDHYMIPITITICLIAIAPFIAPDLNFTTEVLIIPESEEKTKQYFQTFEENINNTKENIRDLMAEHEANNP